MNKLKNIQLQMDSLDYFLDLNTLKISDPHLCSAKLLPWPFMKNFRSEENVLVASIAT